jgi:hypothetical protein
MRPTKELINLLGRYNGGQITKPTMGCWNWADYGQWIGPNLANNLDGDGPNLANYGWWLLLAWVIDCTLNKMTYFLN